MLSKTEAEKPREHRIHAEEKPVSGAPGRGDCAAEAEAPVEGIGTGRGDDSWITNGVCKILLWGFIPPRWSTFSLSTGDSLSLPQHLRNFCGSLKHRGTAPNFWLIMGVSLSKLSKTLEWQLFSFCALLGLQESFFTWEPHCPASFIPPHSQAPQRLSPLPQVLPGVRWASLLFADTTVPFWYGAMSVLFCAAPAFASVSHGTQAPQDQSASRSIREFAFKLLPQSSPEVRRQLTFLLA